MAEGKRHAGEGIANLETARVLAENQEDVLRKWEARIRDHFTGIQLAEVAPAETISADIAAVFQRLLDRLRGNQSPQEYASFHHWIYDGGQYGIELSDITHVLQSLKKAAREAIRETVDDFSRAMQMELQIGEAVDGMVLRAGELFQVARREDMRVMRARFEQISDAWEVEETLTRAETSDEVFRLACEKLEEFFPVSGCLVRLYEGKNKSKAEVSAGKELCSIEELPVPMAVGRPQYLTKEEMDSRGAIDLLELSRRRGEVIVRDVTAGSGLEADQMTLFGPRVSAELVNGDELWRVGIKSIACVPLRAIDRVVGVLLIAAGEEKAFPEERHAMLEDLGDVLGPAFARVAHMEQSRREMTEAEVIARIGRVLLEVPTLEFLLLAVVEALQQFRDYWHASVFRVETLQGEDGPRQECVLMSEAGPGKGRWTEDRRIHFGEGVVGQAAQKGQQIVKSGKNADMDIVVEKDERRVVSPGTSVEAVPEASENFSEIAVPIKRGDTVIGVFDCVSREPHAFQEGERSALQNLSTHIGLGLQNVELLQQQRRTRRELERVHSQLSSIVRNTAVGITGLDNQGIFTHWSPSCEKLLGYKEEEIVGKRKLSDLSAEAVDMEELLENCTKQGEIIREVVLLHKDGTPLIVQEMMEPMVDENGERVGFTASLLDVTEKRQHEEAIRRERNNLNLVVEAMGAGLALFDRDCRLNWANKTLLDWFNCAGEDGEPENRTPCGQVFGCSQSSPAEAEAGCDSSCPLADAVETGELETGLIERVDPDGVWHCYMQVARPVEFGQSQFLVLTLDVTERRRQTEQVQLINRLTRALEHTPAVSASEEGTLSLDLDQIYHLILTCVTAGHALGFNRAFIPP
ncbi:MAG: GAF domain-containing protein, partial [Planctomycetes bacterium]|nr:GAF domain-containing protein [Planctomycetota bacterium]